MVSTLNKVIRFIYLMGIRVTKVLTSYKVLILYYASDKSINKD